MRTKYNSLILASLIITTVFAFGTNSLVCAQDPVKVDEKHYKLVYEDEQIRILKVTLRPKEKATRHMHPPGTVIHLTSNKATFTLPYSKFGTNEAKQGVTNELEEASHSPENNSDSTFEALIVEIKKQAEVQADAKPGQVERICVDKAVPTGWVITDAGDTDFVKCGSSFDNVKTIKKVAGLPTGTTLTVCKNSPVPDGWEVKSTSTDFTRCGPDSSFDNIKEIKRVQ